MVEGLGTRQGEQGKDPFMIGYLRSKLSITCGSSLELGTACSHPPPGTLALAAHSCITNRQTDRQTHTHTDRHRHTHTDRKGEKDNLHMTAHLGTISALVSPPD